MPTHDPTVLDAPALTRRLHELVGDERKVQVEFLLHLDEFDRRQAFLPAGYGSLWDYCLKALHLREGAAGRPSASQPMRADQASSVLPLLGSSRAPEQVAKSMRGEADAEGLPDAVESEERPRVRRAEVHAVSRDQWSLRVTLDAALKKDLEDLTALLSHKVPKGELAEVLREAVQCAIEKHGRRRGAVAPKRRRPNGSDVVNLAKEGAASGTPANVARPTIEPDAKRAPAAPRAPGPAAARAIAVPPPSRTVPLAVRRDVWKRDGGRCTFTSEDGQRCESTWQLELDHVESAALGGEPSVENLRLRCRKHNFHHAEQVFGREFMARYRRDRTPFQPSVRLGASAQGRVS